MRAGTSGTTVTGVAYRWGFNHPSRFAADYGLQFGEYPSETLRRHGRDSFPDNHRGDQ